LQNEMTTTEFFTLSLHDALPICQRPRVPYRPAHPRAARSRHRRSLSDRQPLERRAADADSRRWLRARGDGAAFGRRHRLHYAWEADTMVRAGHRGAALLPVGPRSEGGAFEPLVGRHAPNG